MANQLKCFICNIWTSSDLMMEQEFYGTKEVICMGCYQQLQTRDGVLKTAKKGVEASEQAKRAKEDNGSGRSTDSARLENQTES